MIINDSNECSFRILFWVHTVAIIETNKMDWKTKVYQRKEKKYVQVVSKYLLSTNIESVMSSKRGFKGHFMKDSSNWIYDKEYYVIEYYLKFGLQHPHIDCALVIILYSNNLQRQQWEHSNGGNQAIPMQQHWWYWGPSIAIGFDLALLILLRLPVSARKDCSGVNPSLQ